MRVRAVRGFSGLRGTHAPGDVFDLPDGVNWLEAGLVEPVDTGEVEVLSRSEVETESDVPGGFTGLVDREWAGWFWVCVGGVVEEKLQGSPEEAERRLRGLTD